MTRTLNVIANQGHVQRNLHEVINESIM